MATNDFIEEGLTDDYDIYGSEGSPSALPGSPTIDASGHLVIPPEGMEQYFPPSGAPQNASVFDPDPNNTGPTTDFWTAFPITIDINGYLFYYGENTGINVRGPQGMSNIRFDDLTPAQLAQITGPAGQNGINGTNGIDGVDGSNGLSAYELWLQENGYSPEEHPLDEFFEYLANIQNTLIKEGVGFGSLLVNNKGEYNVANGVSAFASGYYTSANGNYSSSFGLHTTASNTVQSVFGMYNENKPTSVFEVGYGTNVIPRNVFEISNVGNLIAAGNITDGTGNVLSNKVDKIQGKGLSTNDFTNTYKQWIDDFTIDTTVTGDSNNPVSSAAVYTKIQEIAGLNGKSELEQATGNYDFTLGTVLDTSTETLEILHYVSDLKWNPNKRIFKNNNISTNTFTNITSFGSEGLEAASNDQFIFGKYNDPVATDLFQLGYGIDGEPQNVFTISKTGDLVAAGDITDGAGNVLSEKQDILEYDTEPTENSNNLITSGDWYNYLLSIGINPETGVSIPEIPVLQNAIAALTLRVTALEAAVAAIGNPREIPDDTYPNNIYTYGINQDKFYIQQIRPVPTPEPEEDDEEEESEE